MSMFVLPANVRTTSAGKGCDMMEGHLHVGDLLCFLHICADIDVVAQLYTDLYDSEAHVQYMLG